MTVCGRRLYLASLVIALVMALLLSAVPADVNCQVPLPTSTRSTRSMLTPNASKCRPTAISVTQARGSRKKTDSRTGPPLDLACIYNCAGADDNDLRMLARREARVDRAALCACIVLLLGGCDRIGRAWQSWHLSSLDRDIEHSTQAIEIAKDDAQRAARYTERGRAYSEKARYGRAFKLISADECARLFGLAIKDHDTAVALAPGSAEVYFSRGQTYYDRAAGLEAGPDAHSWFAPAAVDFQKAVERNARHDRALDMLGLVHVSTGELDKAIPVFTQEMALNPLGRSRLADAYCLRGASHQKEKRYDAATADYEKAIEIGVTADGCSCEPYNPAVALYTESRSYDKAWEVVHKGQKSRSWIAPELIEGLRKNSGRND